MKFITIKHEGSQYLATDISWEQGQPTEIETVARFVDGVEWEYLQAIVDLLNKHKDELEEV